MNVSAITFGIAYAAVANASCSRTPKELPAQEIRKDAVTSARSIGTSTAGCPSDPDPASFAPESFEMPFDGVSFRAAYVFRSEDTAHGLMYRKDMPEAQGMLFKMKNEVHTFWMHNTCMSLDMFFLDEQGFVVGILEQVPRLNDAPRSVGRATPYVLETNAGYASRHAIHLGSKLEIPVKIRNQQVP
jgi:uncharacterized membrane protein (UPF0127 family)